MNKVLITDGAGSGRTEIFKIEDIFRFKVTAGFEEGLTQFYNWAKDQEHANSGYEESLSEMEKTGIYIRK